MLRPTILLSCVFVMACVPIPSRKIRGVTGSAKSEDFSFVKEGSTTRDEVIQKLRWMDTGIDESRFFWGRWSSSKVIWVGGAPQLGAGAIRPWSTKNLVIDFDEKDTVVRSRLVEDGVLVTELLSSWKRSGRTPLERSMVRAMDVRFVEAGQVINATLRVRGGTLEIRETAGAPRSVRRSIAEIFRLSVPPREGDEPNLLTVGINFREGLDTPEYISFRLAARHFYTLLKYAASSDASVPNPAMRPPGPISPGDGAVLSGSPRRPTLRWNPTPGAIAYIVQWEYKTGTGWSDDQRELPNYDRIVSRTSYTFDFIGSDEGRWRVWPVNTEGIRGSPSEWRSFRFTR
jgi:hypothetical protein